MINRKVKVVYKSLFIMQDYYNPGNLKWYTVHKHEK